MKIPFLGGAYAGRSANVSAQECVNLYYEPPAKHEQNDGALVATDGGLRFAGAMDPSSAHGGASPQQSDDNLNPCRASFVWEDSNPSGATGGGGRRAFFLIKNSLYEWYTNGAGDQFLRDWDSNLIISTFSGRASIAANNVGQLILVDGSAGFILEGTSIQKISDMDFIPTDMVVHQDGYFVTTEPGTNRFRYSAINNGLDWSALGFQSAEGAADIVVSLLSDRRELWVFGDRTTEIYYNAGDPDIPFKRFQNGYMETGIAAKFSAAKHDNSVVWLAKNDRGEAQVVRAGDNWTPIVISPPEINYQIQQYSVIDDAFAYTYQSEGHEFYVLTFPSANATWAYDALTQEWHRRSHTIDGQAGRERFNTHIFYEGNHLMGDYQNGRIYKLDSNVGILETDGEGTEDPIIRVRTSPGGFAENEPRVRVSELQLDMEEGVNDANVWLSYSKDGGHTFSNERPRSVGAVGEYAKRIVWRKLGKARHWVLRIRTWSTGKVIIKGVYARLYGESESGGTR
jgi:hypothetical protein